MDPGLKIHPSLFGAFKNEVAEHQLIKIFVTMGSKNYSYDLIDSVTNEVVGRITKIRGLTLQGSGSIAINTDAMLEFVRNTQEDKRVDKEVPQYRIWINSVSKTLSANEVKSLYCNFSNEKRYYAKGSNSTKLWPYGTTRY